MSIRLNGSTSGYTEIDAPAVAGSNTLVLPTGNGSSGQYLQTNGSGALSWATLPASGKILQVLQQVKTDRQSTTSTSWTDVTDTSISITVNSSSSKVVVLCAGVAANDQNGTMIKLVRGSTDIWLGNTSSSRTRTSTGNMYEADTNSCTPFAINYMDTPGSGTHTYKLQFRVGASGGGTAVINGSVNNTDAAYTAAAATSIILLEASS